MNIEFRDNCNWGKHIISNGHVVQIDYGGEMAMKLKNNSNQRTKEGEKKHWNKRLPVKRQRKKNERWGVIVMGPRRVIGSYWCSDWQVMNGPIHLMPRGKWAGVRASQVTRWSGRERLELWYKSLTHWPHMWGHRCSRTHTQVTHACFKTPRPISLLWVLEIMVILVSSPPPFDLHLFKVMTLSVVECPDWIWTWSELWELKFCAIARPMPNSGSFFS